MHITPTENAQTLTLFQEGDLDGAWVPEPWASRLVLEGGAHVLVDEAELWEDGAFPTTVLLVRADFLAEHPDASTELVAGAHRGDHVDRGERRDASAAINAQLEVDDGQAAGRTRCSRGPSRT